MSDIAKGITDCLDLINKLRKENTAQAARIETLEAALRGLDDMIVDLDAGHRELHEVSRFINGALTGWKR